MILFGEVVNIEYQISYLKPISMCFAISMSFLSWGSSKFLPSKLIIRIIRKFNMEATFRGNHIPLVMVYDFL